nr:uncharacterized protein LOC123763223 isoform X2 [Procambarus clarkii]
MATHFAPAFRTPLTDLTGRLLTHQSSPKCADFEMRAMECLEAYGVQRGRIQCIDYLDDLRECAFETKQKGDGQGLHSVCVTFSIHKCIFSP